MARVSRARKRAIFGAMLPSEISGKIVVLTGKFSEVDRAQAEAALGRLGATIGASVTKTTSILFAGERAGSKLAKARQLGVTILDEAALKALLAAAPAAPAAPEAPEAAAGVAGATTPSRQVEGLSGKSVALTGTFVLMKRAEAQRLLREAGAAVGGGVTRSTELLVYGDDAGSKLDDAARLGVKTMSEAELVALLIAGGVADPLLAGAGEKLAQKAAERAEEATEMTKVVAELKAFVQALRARKDVHVRRAEIGRRAGKSKLEQLRGIRAPQEMIDLYAEMDGIHVEWSFIEPTGGGCIRVPAVSQWTRFTGDDSHYMNFGEDEEALLFDEITAEGNTWLVRSKQGEKGSGPRRASIIFASAAEGSDGVIAANSLAEYLREAMKSGFVSYWPRCFRPLRNVSYAEQEATIRRFQATPAAPVAITPGARVEFFYFSEGGRGEALALFTAQPSAKTEHNGAEFVQVRLDEGTIAWIPKAMLKACTRRDAYERLREPSFDLEAAAATDLRGLCDSLIRAINPLAHYSTAGIGALSSNARRAAGLLSARPLAAALSAVVGLYAAISAAGLDLSQTHLLVETGDEFSPAELSRLRWQYELKGLLAGMFGGALILVHHASARAGAAPAVTLAAGLRASISAKLADAAPALVAACSSAEVLSAPRWDHSSVDDAAALGLAPGSIVLCGSGY
jgi:BRCT domain type II-containing protein